MRRIPDLPELNDDPAELRRLINDRLHRIDSQLSSGGADLANVPAATKAKDAVPLQQVNALLAGLRADVAAQINAAKVTAPADPVTQTAGSQVVLSIPGTLAIESNAAQLISFKDARKVVEVELLVKRVPVGAPIDVRILVDGATMATVTLLAGQSGVKSAAAFAIAAGKPVRIDVLSVGVTFPGADLSVILRF
jgi:hypothetical protein